MSICAVEDCSSYDPMHGCMVHHRNKRVGPLACKYGQFVTGIVERFGCYGRWKFRAIGGYSDTLVATLAGKGGKVEIWGGLTHRDEVWAFPKGTNGCLIGTVTNAETVEMACGRVGLQRRLVDA